MTSFPSSKNDQKVQIALLLANKTLIIIPPEYFEFVDNFFLKSATELPEYMGINDHTIDLV